MLWGRVFNLTNNRARIMPSLVPNILILINLWFSGSAFTPALASSLTVGS